MEMINFILSKDVFEVPISVTPGEKENNLVEMP